MQFSQAFIERLKGSVSVSDVVGKVVALRHHGREFQGLCPFHKEKTPSFTVNDEKGFYHCFGCAAHGDQVGFLMQYESISYPEAVKRLCEMTGTPLPTFSPEEQRRESENKRLHDVIDVAMEWFEARLQSAQGRAARDYLQQRGLKSETIAHFRLGFAPVERGELLSYLTAKGIALSAIKQAGLAIEPDDGRSAYSRFRARLMFPIMDRGGKVVGFGGRVLPSMAQMEAAKYLNSPDGELFHKGQLLYNHHNARKAAAEKKRVIVCEGYMDVIALSQAGFEEVVAPLGTALTEMQLQLLWKLCDYPILCLDADAAGQRAMRRACEMALPHLVPGKGLRFVTLPAGEDPDSFVMRFGHAAMEKKIAEAEGIADRLWAESAPRMEHSPEAKAAQEHALMQQVEKIQHPMVKAHFRRHIKELMWPFKRGSEKARLAMTGTKPMGSHLPIHASKQMDDAAMQCLIIVMLYPPLMQEGEIEEAIGQLELHNRAMIDFQQWLIAWLLAHPESSRAESEAALAAKPFDVDMLALVQRHQQAIPQKLLKDAAQTQQDLARQIFYRVALNAYQSAQLQRECEQAELAGAAGLNEATQERITALKRQMEALLKERNAVYFEEWLSDAS